ncbi:hypothetical protein ACLKA6_018814 [Drosophila palustris]
MSEIDRCSMPLIPLISDPKLSANALRQQQRLISNSNDPLEELDSIRLSALDVGSSKNSTLTEQQRLIWFDQQPQHWQVPASTRDLSNCRDLSDNHSSVVQQALHSATREAVVSYINQNRATSAASRLR